MPGKVRMSEKEAIARGLIPLPARTPEPEPPPKYDGTWYRAKMAEIEANRISQAVTSVPLVGNVAQQPRTWSTWVLLVMWLIGFICGRALTW